MRLAPTGLAILVAAALGVACDDETGPAGTLDFTFQLDDSFQGAHGGQDIYVAVVRASDGTVVARESGTVSATADPAFSITIDNALDEDEDYEIHYWIDSNFGGGAEGVCDPAANDHQWNRSVSAASDDVTLAETHEPSETENVCATFTADLTFAGDETFQGAHGGQDIMVAVVRASDGLIVAEDDGTVSGTADPSFEFEFDGALVIGETYELHYWIDSNFSGGTMGSCDPPAIDHQWLLDVGEVENDVAIAETHQPAETTDVCDTFTS